MNANSNEITGDTRLVHNQLLNAYNQTIGFPVNGGTLALISDIKEIEAETINIANAAANSDWNANANILQQEINYLATRLQATLQYFQNKIHSGNISFSDIIEKVDSAVESSSLK